jgi:hypothetical protein
MTGDIGRRQSVEKVIKMVIDQNKAKIDAKEASKVSNRLYD